MPSNIPDASYTSWLANTKRPSLATASPEDTPSESAINLGLSSCSTPIPLQSKGRKRALLIAIRTYADTNYPELPGAQKDVEEMHRLLLEVYAYTEDEITVLLDDGIEDHLQPTRANILAAIGDFVKDVKSGDHLFFYYCGHSTQVKNRTNSEEDGMDECLVPMDGEDHKIVDNELHRRLVKPLPAGACLVAVLDTCHSGSLLDLKHHRCNRVYVPWKWPGKRSSEEIRSNVRHNAAPLEIMSPTDDAPIAVSSGSQPKLQRLRGLFGMSRPVSGAQLVRRPMSMTNGLEWPASSRASSARRGGSLAHLSRRHGHTLPLSIAVHGKENAKSTWILQDEGRQSASPVSQFPCDGFCRNRVNARDEGDAVKADVISLASCRDSQVAYESNGKSMTSHLVGILRKNPNCTLQDVMSAISHAMYSMALERHIGSRQYKRDNKAYILNLTEYIKGLELTRSTRGKLSSQGASSVVGASGTSSSRPTKACKGSSPMRKLSDRLLRMKAKLLKAQKQYRQSAHDVDNFQNPELSSPWPLDMSRAWPMPSQLTR